MSKYIIIFFLAVVNILSQDYHKEFNITTENKYIRISSSSLDVTKLFFSIIVTDTGSVYADTLRCYDITDEGDTLEIKARLMGTKKESYDIFPGAGQTREYFLLRTHPKNLLIKLANKQNISGRRVKVIVEGFRSHFYDINPIDIDTNYTIVTAMPSISVAVDTIKYILGGNIAITNPSIAVTGTFWQATQPISISQTTTNNDVDANITNASVAVTQSGTWNVGITGTPTVTVANLHSVVGDTVFVSNMSGSTTKSYYQVWTGSQTLAQNRYLMAFLNNAGSGQTLTIESIYLINTALTAVTGVGVQFDIRRITTITGGTTVTANSLNTSSAALTNITSVFQPTAVSESTLLLSHYTNNDEVGLTNAFFNATVQSRMNLLLYPVTLNAGEGITLKQITNTTVGGYGLLILISK